MRAESFTSPSFWQRCNSSNISSEKILIPAGQTSSSMLGIIFIAIIVLSLLIMKNKQLIIINIEEQYIIPQLFPSLH